MLSVAALPLSLTIWGLGIAMWTGAWGMGNLAFGLKEQSAGALSRGLGASGVSLEVFSRIAGGWGRVSSGVPASSALVDASSTLHQAARTATLLAPLAPDMFGFTQPSLYLVSALNDAELFGSGGAPLDVAVIEVDKARFRVTESGSVGKFNPNNAPYAWPITGSVPWYEPQEEYPFANSNFHPNFPYSGRNMLSAWRALGQPEVDGVVTVDVAAVAAVLAAVGPIKTSGYGEVTSDNVVRKVLIDSYRRLPVEIPGAMGRRQEANDELRAELLSHAADWRTALKAFAGLWSAVPGRHVQAYMDQQSWQDVVVSAGLDAQLATPAGDIAGVFIQSGVSKLAVFQDRRIEHRVTVGVDGSAHVTQTVTFTNAVPDGLPGDRTTNRGYLALIFRQRVALRIPERAEGPRVAVGEGEGLVLDGQTGPYPDDTGAQVLWQGMDIPAGRTRTLITDYDLPAGTFGTGSGQEYTLTANPQAMVTPVAVSVMVRFDAGATAPSEGWDVTSGWARWQGTLDRTVNLSLPGPS